MRQAQLNQVDPNDAEDPAGWQGTRTIRAPGWRSFPVTTTTTSVRGRTWREWQRPISRNPRARQRSSPPSLRHAATALSDVESPHRLDSGLTTTWRAHGRAQQ